MKKKVAEIEFPFVVSKGSVSVKIYRTHKKHYDFGFNGLELCGARAGFTLCRFTLIKHTFRHHGHFYTISRRHVQYFLNKKIIYSRQRQTYTEGNVNDIIGTNNGTLMNGATFAAAKVGQGLMGWMLW